MLRALWGTSVRIRFGSAGRNSEMVLAQIKMARRLYSRLLFLPSHFKITPQASLRSPFLAALQSIPGNSGSLDVNFGCRCPMLHFQKQAARSYARGRRSDYDLFGGKVPGSKEFRKTWAKQMNDEEDCLWTASEDDESDKEDDHSRLKKDIKKAKQRAKKHSDRIDADDSDELWSVWSGSDEEKTLWTGSEEDDDDDIPTEPYPNERSDQYIDRLFEFEEKPKYRTLSEALKDEEGPEELSPGKQARKLALQNALKKLKKGPDGRYTNVWEVMSDLDVLIAAFENIVSGPEYEELRQGGPKKLNMEFFKDIQAKMRDPNYKFSPELKLKPKSKFVPRKRWQKAQSRRRKAQKR